MKYVFLHIILLIFSFLALHAELTIKDTTAKNAMTGSVQLRLKTAGVSDHHQDSALVIFDKANHSGAGFIYQVYTADSRHAIDIPAVPPGKYYVTIKCMGLHKDYFERSVKVCRRKKSRLTVTLEDTEEFSKERVVIPAFRPDLMTLAAYARAK